MKRNIILFLLVPISVFSVLSLSILAYLCLAAASSSPSAPAALYEEKPDSSNSIRNRLIQDLEWPRTTSPRVVICSGTPVEKEDVLKAISWWADRGYLIHSTVEVNSDLAQTICDREEPHGYIILDSINRHKKIYPDKEVPWLNLATTYNMANRHDQIYWSRIFFRVAKERTLEHEIGHALGWMHSDEPGHLMNEYQKFGGWNDAGLRK